MYSIYFKNYDNEKLPSYIEELIDSIVGYSRIDDSPIYHIQFNNKNILLDKIYDDNYDYYDIKNQINEYLRKQKIKKIISNIIDDENEYNELEKFNTFLNFYRTSNTNIVQIN